MKCAFQKIAASH